MSTSNSDLHDLPKYDDLIYDVGMHKGEDTDFYLKKGFQVIGFEADPALEAVCRDRFAADLRKGRLVIVGGAIVPPERIAAGEHTVKFYRNDEISYFGSVDGAWAESHKRCGGTTTIEVPTVDFAASLTHYGVPHYMKIDIEGMDEVCLECLRGCVQKPNYVSIEAEILNLSRLQKQICNLTQLGYVAFQAVQQSNIESQMLPPVQQEGTAVEHRFEPGSSGAFGRDLPDQWKSQDDTIRLFQRIIAYRRAFGVDAPLCRTALGRKVVWKTLRMLGRGAPGWYDTHARHESVPEETSR